MKTKKLISTVIIITTLALAFFFIKNNISDFKQLTIENPLLILARAILVIATMIILGLINKTLLKPLEVKINLLESTKISIVNSFYNLITPFRGGIAARAIYLKRKYNLKYTKFLGLVATSTLLVVLISSILGIIATILIYLKENIFNPIIPIIFIATLIITLTVAIISPTIKETKYSLINNIIRIINSFSQINKNKFFLIAAILTTIQILIAAYATQLTFAIFGIEISFVKTLFLSAIGGISLIISLTPANLGVSEAIMVFSAQTIGISTVEALSVAILGRLIQFVVLFTLGPIVSYKLMKK
ncbi:flippase-like domain-containing protein [archaeon]|nr:flippase-like domain-containing protein [archaeon]